MPEVPALKPLKRKASTILSHKKYEEDPSTRDWHKLQSAHKTSSSDIGKTIMLNSMMEKAKQREQEFKRKYWELNPSQGINKQRLSQQKKQNPQKKMHGEKNHQKDTIIERAQLIPQQNRQSTKPQILFQPTFNSSGTLLHHFQTGNYQVNGLGLVRNQSNPNLDRVIVRGQPNNAFNQVATTNAGVPQPYYHHYNQPNGPQIHPRQPQPHQQHECHPSVVSCNISQSPPLYSLPHLQLGFNGTQPQPVPNGAAGHPISVPKNNENEVQKSGSNANQRVSESGNNANQRVSESGNLQNMRHLQPNQNIKQKGVSSVHHNFNGMSNAVKNTKKQNILNNITNVSKQNVVRMSVGMQNSHCYQNGSFKNIQRSEQSEDSLRHIVTIQPEEEKMDISPVSNFRASPLKNSNNREQNYLKTASLELQNRHSEQRGQNKQNVRSKQAHSYQEKTEETQALQQRKSNVQNNSYNEGGGNKFALFSNQQKSTFLLSPPSFHYLPAQSKEKAEQAMDRLNLVISDLDSNDQADIKDHLLGLKELKEENWKVSYNYLLKMDHILAKYSRTTEWKPTVQKVEEEESVLKRMFGNIRSALQAKQMDPQQKLQESVVSPYSRNSNRGGQAFKHYLSLSKNMRFDYEEQP